jgi:hypothetical protein
MWRIILLVPALWMLAGANCVPERQTSIVLRNQTNFTVDVELYYHHRQEIPQFLIDETGTRMTFSIPPNGVESFSRPCEDLQAIYIKDAQMRVLPGISPDANTRIYREPDDFGCANTLTFTFTQNVIATSLNVSFAQSQ